MSEILLGLVFMIVTQIIKVIYPRFGKLGIHLFLLGIGTLVALLQYGWTFLPEVQAQTIIGIWASAVAFYELLVKRIGKDLVGARV